MGGARFIVLHRTTSTTKSSCLPIACPTSCVLALQELHLGQVSGIPSYVLQGSCTKTNLILRATERSVTWKTERQKQL